MREGGRKEEERGEGGRKGGRREERRSKWREGRWEDNIRYKELHID